MIWRRIHPAVNRHTCWSSRRPIRQYTHSAKHFLGFANLLVYKAELLQPPDSTSQQTSALVNNGLKPCLHTPVKLDLDKRANPSKDKTLTTTPAPNDSYLYRESQMLLEYPCQSLSVNYAQPLEKEAASLVFGVK